MLYGRVTLLGLFIVLFAGLWSSDQPSKRQDYLTRHQSSRYLVDRKRGHSAGKHHPQIVKSAPHTQSGRFVQSISRPKTTLANFPIHDAGVRDEDHALIHSSAIPNDLSVGYYRVVSTRGTVKLITVTHDMLKREHIPDQLPPRDIYTRQTPIECWYWIRLDRAAPPTKTAAL